QAEDGIRDFHVTGVQTCALPISLAFLSLGCVASAQRAAQVVTPPDFPVELVERGVQGYALTAGADNVIERFDITVLGVQHDAVRSEERRVGKECRSRRAAEP